MTKNQILKFIEKHGGPNIKVQFRIIDTTARVHPRKRIIIINFTHINKFEEATQKDVLLHEIGHIRSFDKGTEKYYRCSSNEYNAHTWAIIYAHNTPGLHKTFKSLLKTAKDWTTLKWNKNKKYRIYIKAGRKIINAWKK